MLWEPNTVWSRGLNECSQFIVPGTQIAVGKELTTNSLQAGRTNGPSGVSGVSEGVNVGVHEAGKKEISR